MDLFGLGIVLDFTDRASEGLLNTTRIFDQANVSAEKMASNIDSNLKKFTELSIVSSSVSQLGSSISNMGSGIMGSISSATEQATSMEKELQTLQFTSGLTGEAFERLRKTAIQTGIETAFSPQEATQAMYELMSAGLDTEDMLKSLNSTLNLVAVSGEDIDLGTGASLVASTLKKFNLEASQSKMVVDQLSEASKVSNFHFADFSAFINSLQAAPTSINRPLEEFLGAGAMLRNVGQGAAQAGSTVNGFARQLMTLTRQLEMTKTSSSKMAMKKDMMEQLGLKADTIWDTTGAMRPLQDVLGSIITQMQGMTDQKKAVIAQTLFGDQAKNLLTACETATKDMLALDESTGEYVTTTTDGKMSIDQMVESIKKANGTCEEGADAMLKTTWGIQKLWEGSKQTFQILLGNTILPILGTFITSLTKVLNVLIAFTDQHPKIAKALGLGVGMTGLFLLAFGGIIKFVGSMGMAIAGIGMFTNTVIPFISKLMGLGSTAFSISAIMGGLGSKILGLALIAAKGALIFGGMYLAWKTDFLGVRSLLNYLITSVHTAFSEASRIAGLGVESFSEQVRRLADSGSLWDNFCLFIIKAKVLWEALCESWNTNTLSDETFQKVGQLGLLPLLSFILDCKQRIESFWEGFKQGFANVSEIVKTIFMTIANVIGEVINLIVPNTTIVDDFATSFNGVDSEKWIAMGEAVAYVVSALAGLWAIGKIVSIISFVCDGLFTAVTIIGNIAELIGSAFSIISAIGSAIVSVLGLIGGAVAAIAGLFGVVIALPAEIVGAIVIAVVTAVAAVIYYWDEIVSFFSNMCTSIGEFFVSAWGTICTVFSDSVNWVSTNVITPMLTFFSNLGQGIVLILSGVWDIIVGVVEIALGIMKLLVGLFIEGVMTVVSPIIDFFVAVWDVIVSSAQACWDWIVSIITSAWSYIEPVWSVVVDFFSSIWDGIVSVATSTWDWISNIAINAYSYITSVWGVVVDFFSSIWSAVCGVVSSIIDAIVSYLTNAYNNVTAVWGVIESFFSAIWNAILSVVSSVWSSISSTITSVSSAVQSAWGGVSSFFSGVWGSIKSGAEGLFSWLESKFSWVAGSVEKIQSGWSSISGGVGNIIEGGKKMLGLSTGGYIMQEGAAVLHPNEVVLNSRLTTGLGQFLENQQKDDKDLGDINVTPIDINPQPQNPEDDPQPKNFMRAMVVNTSPVVNTPTPSTTPTSEGSVDNSVVFSEGAIQIYATQCTPEEAQRLAQIIIDKIKKEQQLNDVRKVRPA